MTPHSEMQKVRRKEKKRKEKKGKEKGILNGKLNKKKYGNKGKKALTSRSTELIEKRRLLRPHALPSHAFARF